MTMHNIIGFEVIDYFDGDSFFGKVIAKSDLRDMTPYQKVTEKIALAMMFPGHSIVEVIEVPACG